MALGIQITSGTDRYGRPLWSVGVDDDETDSIVAVFPASSEDQAQVIAQQLAQLLAYLAGQPPLGNVDTEGSA